MNNQVRPHIGFLAERMTLGFGVDIVIHEQAMRLVQRGYSVTVFPIWKTDLYDNQPYKIVPLAVGDEDAPNFYSPAFMKQSFEIINQHDIGIWMIHTPPFYFWLPHFHAPVIMVEHGTPPGKFFGYRQGRHLDMQTRKRQRRVFRNMRPGDGLVAISDYIRSELPVDVQRSTLVIHNGADHYPKATQEQIREFRRLAGAGPSDILTVWVGRIQPVKDPQPYKGLHQLLRLGRKIQNETSSIRLIAVGRGDEAAGPVLQNAGITPFFNLPREKMAAVYAAADIFLNTSMWEGFNLPLVEAQFQGTPVIALKVCAHPEVVADGFSGVLVHAQADQFNALNALAQDPERRRQLGIGAARHVAEFTWERNVDKLEKLIQDSMKVFHSREPVTPVRVELNKNRRYYLDHAEYLYHQFGWKTFVRECFGWLKRRLPVRKK
jgi:glycosyltransferase involved in cell wall biosynthesis